MTLEEMESAIRDAELVLKRADYATSLMARVIRGRLRHADRWVVADLKRELRDYNIHTSEWKGRVR